MYNSIFYDLPADVYKMYNKRIHVGGGVYISYEVACTIVYYIIFQPTCTLYNRRIHW